MIVLNKYRNKCIQNIIDTYEVKRAILKLKKKQWSLFKRAVADENLKILEKVLREVTK